MKKTISVLLSSIFSFICLSCVFSARAYDLHTPALTPVKFQQSPVHGALPLIKDGDLNFAIAFDQKLETRGWPDYLSIRPAVSLLQEAILNCTGKEAPVIDTNNAEALKKHTYLILVGDNAPVRGLGVDFRKLPEQGFIIRTFDRGIVIVGHDSSQIPGSLHCPLRGTLWGAYDFIERFLGCRFYFPGKLGSLWPKTTDLLVKPVCYTDSPRFVIRDTCQVVWEMMGADNKKFWEPFLGTFKKGTIYPDDVPFVDRWRMGRPSIFWAGHSPNPLNFAKAYPDKLETIFYRAPNGTQYYNPESHSGNYFNVLDFKFADLLVDSLKKFFKSKGKENDGWVCISDEYIPFGQCDNEIPLPDMISNPTVVREKLITDNVIKNADPYSDIYGRFYQYLGNRFKKEFPGKKLVLLPYSSYTRPPVDPRWVLPDNIELRVCVYDMDRIRNPEKAAKWKKIIDDWAQAQGGRPVASLWLYNVPGNQFARAIAPMMIKDVIKLFGKNLGNTDIFLDQYGRLEWWHYCANYVQLKTVWNEDFDGMAAIDEHWEPMYGPEAGPVLRDFFKLVYDSYMKYYVPSKGRSVLYPPEVIDRMEALLKKAGSLLKPGSVEMQRFKLFSHPWPQAFATQRNLISYERPLHGIPQLLDSEQVTIDGKEESFWKKVKPIPLRDPKGSDEKPLSPISIRLAWNQQGIYALASMGYNPENKGNQPVWNSDGIECLICPTLEDRHMFHFSVDSLNRHYFGFQEFHPVDKPYADWKCQGFKSAVCKTGENSWNIECFMPFEAMKYPVPQPYDCWRINALQNRRTGCYKAFGSAVTTGTNMNRKMFGVIKFLGKGE